MAKYRMLKDAHGCPDGIHAELFVEGGEYELPERLAKNFLIMEVCEPMNEEAQTEKAEKQAPKNKAIKAAPKNKAE